MKIQITYAITTVALLLVNQPSLADDAGKALFDKSCTGCHGTEVFTRDDRSVETLEALKERVKQCSLAAESKWNDDEADWVVQYLNKNYYKF
jgi:mono/diheme cytochrome c family protein